jgi:hypothetical protein
MQQRTAMGTITKARIRAVFLILNTFTDISERDIEAFAALSRPIVVRTK